MIRFGVAGWDYKDWWGTVYPASPPAGFDPLHYLARYFDLVEINSTFYGAGSPKAAASWVKRVRDYPRFCFSAKLWKRFTHDRDNAWTPDDVAQMQATLDPIAGHGRLGCLLAQYPWSFRRSPENEEWLADVIRAFAQFPLAIEVRHASWNDPAFYASLADQGVGIVNIDQPLFRHSLPPGRTVTGPIGYVRLHGRNFENWFRERAATHERYDYLYTAEELGAWLERIHAIAQETRDTFVVANNHYLGKAPANAAMLRKLFERTDVAVPPDLARKYQDVLKPLGIEAGPEGDQLSL